MGYARLPMQRFIASYLGTLMTDDVEMFIF
jgi:hypothetical protein